MTIFTRPVYDQYGERVALSDVAGPPSTTRHECAEYTEGCWVCFVNLPLGEQMRRVEERRAEVRKTHGCLGCGDVVAEGHRCERCERRWVA